MGGRQFNLDSTVKIQEGTGCIVVANPGSFNILRGEIPVDKLYVLRGGENISFGGVSILGVRAVHVQCVGPLMFAVFDYSSSVAFFHGSDSGFSREAAKYRGLIDVAFLPVGGASPTASVSSALELLDVLEPSVVVSMHGTAEQFSKFAEEVRRGFPEVLVVTPEVGELLKI